jgi:hypothetical protein
VVHTATGGFGWARASFQDRLVASLRQTIVVASPASGQLPALTESFFAVVALLVALLNSYVH